MTKRLLTEYDTLIEDQRVITPRERWRTALWVGSMFAVGIALILFLLAFPQLKTFNDLANLVALVLCFAVPSFGMVTVGTYVQLGYHNLFLRMARRLQKRSADRIHEPPP